MCGCRGGGEGGPFDGEHTDRQRHKHTYTYYTHTRACARVGVRASGAIPHAIGSLPLLGWRAYWVVPCRWERSPVHPLRYRSPVLKDIQAAVRAELQARGAHAALVVFWGRHRYVSILWHYIERNLAVNGGIVGAARAAQGGFWAGWRPCSQSQSVTRPALPLIRARAQGVTVGDPQYYPCLYPR